MSNILIINAGLPHEFAGGTLNASLVDFMQANLKDKGHDVKTVVIHEGYDIEEQISLHTWADYVILQSPVYWMGVPWSAKKYMDEVYTAAGNGQLYNDDGRSSAAPTENYGTGGTSGGKKYMLSLTFNAPVEAFGREEEYLFQGRSIDDLFYPVHMMYRFMDMHPLETFSCHDVVKNPKIDEDFKKLEAHLGKYF